MFFIDSKSGFTHSNNEECSLWHAKDKSCERLENRINLLQLNCLSLFFHSWADNSIVKFQNIVKNRVSCQLNKDRVTNGSFALHSMCRINFVTHEIKIKVRTKDCIENEKKSYNHVMLLETFSLCFKIN